MVLSGGFGSAFAGYAEKTALTSGSGTRSVEVTADNRLETEATGSGSFKAVLWGDIGGGAYRPVQLDDSTHSLVCIEYAHNEIHSGRHFFLRNWVDLTDAGATATFLFRVTDTNRWPHAIWNISGESEFTFELFEDATITDTGTWVNIQNSNRNSGNAATVQAYGDPSYSDIGTLIWAGKIGSGKAVGGVSGRDDDEFIGKQNTDYIFRITKDAAGTHWLEYDFLWYEHVDKD